MVSRRVTERDAIRTIENEIRPRVTARSKRMIIDTDGHGARINLEGGPTGVAGVLAASRQAPDMHTPEDWPVHGVFVALLHGSMFWLGAGVSSLIWWLAA